MDQKVIKIHTVNISDDEGFPIYKHIFTPTYIYTSSIKEMSPRITETGFLYKNSTLIETEEKDFYYIYGNCDKERNRLFNNNKKLGY